MGEPIHTIPNGSTVVVEPTSNGLTVLNPALLPTEQVGPKGWIRTMLNFKLDDDYDLEKIADVLQRGFKAFKKITPIAGCEAVPLEDAKQAGLLQFRNYGDEIEDFVVKDLRSDESTPSFATLAKRGFPTSAMNVDTMCLRGKQGEWPRAGDRLNVMMAQANFLRGGLVLNTLIFHAYADGTTSYKFTEILAQEIRRAQGLAIDVAVEIPVEDREKISKALASSAAETTSLEPKPDHGKPQNHTEYVELPFTPEAMPPKLLLDNHIGHVFHFSPAKVAALKALCSPSNTTSLLKDDSKVASPYVTTNDVLAALIWRSVMAAQYPDVVKDGKKIEDSNLTSTIGIAMDGRRRAHVPIHKHTLGNILGFAPARLTLADLLTKASLADAAAVIHQSVAQKDRSYMDSINTLVENLQDVNRLVPQMFLDMPGTCLLSSSWAEFPYYDLDFGPALGGKIRSVRFPNVGVCHAFQVRLPENPANPGVEYFVCALADDMARLLKDPLWTEFAGRPVDYQTESD